MYQRNMNNLELTIGWLYPDLMSTYGDRGNVLTLEYRTAKRDIKVKIMKISVGDEGETIKQADLIFMGGAQDKQQEIVNRDLEKDKGKYLENAIGRGVPGLYVCGAYQFLGRYYLAADGTRISGLSIFDVHTESPGEDAKRCIGNLFVEPLDKKATKIVGFENHGGRTYLKDTKAAFAKVLKGYGNNGKDGLEGYRKANSIGTYLHGPLLPKNPAFADSLIAKAIEVKYGKPAVELPGLDDSFENMAREVIIRRYLK